MQDAGNTLESLGQANEGLRRELLQHQQAEQSLRDVEERYRELLEALPAYVYSVKLADGRPVSTEHGRGCIAVTGYSPEDYAANPNLWITMVHPDDRDRVRQHIARHLACETTLPVEHRIIHRDGRECWVRDTIIHHFDASGRFVRYDGLVQDITDQKQAEWALRESDRLKAIGTLAGSVAHDLNNIMTVVAGGASAIAESASPNVRLGKAATSILEAVKHAADISRRLVGVSRMCEADPRGESGPVDVVQVIDETIAIAESALTQGDARIRFARPGTQILAKAHSAHLLDVLMNLLLNASEAMSGGGQITIDVAEHTLAPRQAGGQPAARAPFVVIRVRDTGTGIAREVREHMFEPFFTTRQSRAAFGLGLAIARNHVTSWGGWISVRSRVGAGASFRLFLRAARAGTSATHEVFRPGSRGILVVDDAAECLAMMRETLERSGHRVYTADSAAAALAIHKEHAADIAVSVVDLLMARGNGTEVVEAIYRADSQANVVVVSGFSRDYVRSHLPRGAWGFVQKPIEPDKFLDTVNGMLAQPLTMR